MNLAAARLRTGSVETLDGGCDCGLLQIDWG